MSTKLTGYVWDACAASGMKLSSVAIMARLADFSNDEGISWPSIGTIARQIGAGESTVRTAIAQLEKDNWLSRKQRRQGNRNASNVYQLNVAKLQAAAFSHLSDSDPSNYDASKSDASKSDASKFEASKNRAGGSFDPSESGGDPSVKSTTDPQVKPKPSCQVAGQPDREVLITDQAKQVLTHLNQKTGSRYQVCKSSLENIRGRLGEGFTRDELVLVVDYSTAKWGEDLKMAEYLRPTTLFQPTKFPAYLQAATSWEKAGRPVRENGQWVSTMVARSSYENVDYSQIPEGFRG